MISRRDLLVGGAALGALGWLGLPRASLASATTDRSFLFVIAPGGWDVTRVFAPVFDHDGVDLEPDAERGTAGGVRFVDHPARPSVRRFFDAWHDRCLVLNGLVVPSVNHETCTRLVLTGSARDGDPDWGARLGHEARDRATLPHLVLDGPSYPGPHAESVVRAGGNGQLEALVRGVDPEVSALPTAAFSRRSEAIVDRFLRRRAGAVAAWPGADADRALRRAWSDALDRSLALKDLRGAVDLSPGADLADRIALAGDLFEQGLSRCASVSFATGAGWDSHTDNDVRQSGSFEALFDGLLRGLDALAGRPGRDAPSLLDETVVVVLSEMGRTPKLNGALGKDHWPSTSALLLGPGLTTDRVVGGFDDGFFGRALDPGSGEARDGGATLDPRMLGATLLALGGLDPAEALPDVPTLDGVLA